MKIKKGVLSEVFEPIKIRQIQSTPDNSNLQGKSKKRFELSGVRVTGSSKKIAEGKVKKTIFTAR